MTDNDDVPWWTLGLGEEGELRYSPTVAHVWELALHTIWFPAYLSRGDEVKASLWDLLGMPGVELCNPCFFASPRDCAGMARCD